MMTPGGGGKGKQMSFIEQLITNKTRVTIFLVNGVKLTGTIAGLETAQPMHGLILERDGAAQLVSMSAISTIMPNNYHE